MNNDKAKAYRKSKKSFKWFLQNVFWKSYPHLNIYPTPHLIEWADLIQLNKNAALLSARCHLKSTLMYAYVMWKIFISHRKDLKILYLSLNEKNARDHVHNIKEAIRNNPYFDEYKETSEAESTIKGNWRDEFNHLVEGEGMDCAIRGRHDNIVICDDILSDPTQQLDPIKIASTNRIFFEVVLSIPLEEIKVVGTAQHNDDLFFKLQPKPDKPTGFAWSINPAIKNELIKEVLWKDNPKYTYEGLINLRDTLLGERAFKKEYMCSPVWGENSYISRNELMRRINLNLKNFEKTESKPSRIKIVAGLDIGKHVHPSHLAIFEIDGIKKRMIYQRFFDNMEYIKQVEIINELCERFLVDQLRFDNTSRELESFLEQNICPRYLWKPVILSPKDKNSMASNFMKDILSGTIELQNDQRMINSILSVNDNLDAIETSEGHGDAFWSIALALSCKISQPITIIGHKGK